MTVEIVAGLVADADIDPFIVMPGVGMKGLVDRQELVAAASGKGGLIRGSGRVLCLGWGKGCQQAVAEHQDPSVKA